ncbi:MAG: G1 family glutamic endopeptidase [Candidatus Brocadiia bacterium]
MKIIVRGMAGIAVLGLCLLRGPAPAGVVAHGQFYLRAIPSSAVHHLQAPHIHLRDGTSLNWSGYAVETNLSKPASNAVSNVVGSWTVPGVLASTPSKDTYSSAWVGIDGYSDDTVEQIGTEQDWTGRAASYYAWFELYPNYAYEIVGFPVDQGDTITAQVQYLGSETVEVKDAWGRRGHGWEHGRNDDWGRKTTEVVQTFQLTLTNVTKDVTFSIDEQIQGAELQSAEWVMEAPSESSVLPLSDFGTISFSGCEATLDGVTGPITTWPDDMLTMETSKAVTKALPSVLGTTGETFSVTWEHQ